MTHDQRLRPIARRLLSVALSLTFVLCFVAAVATPSFATAQRLDGVSRAVHGSSGSSSSRGYGDRGYGYRRYGGNGATDTYAVTSATTSFLSLFYPYYSSPSGSTSGSAPPVVEIIDANGGYVLDEIGRGEVSALTRIARVVDLQIRYSGYFAHTTAEVRAMGIARLGGAYALVSGDQAQLRLGIAGLLYHDVRGTELGFASGLELDVYPTAPLVLRAEGYSGVLGAIAMFEGRVTVGAQVERCELYVGYNVLLLDLGGAPIPLHGPIAGFRLWIS